MKKSMVLLIAVGIFSAMPAFADHKKDVAPPEKSVTDIYSATDADCAKECDLLLSDCGVQVDSIQQRFQRIKTAIRKDGAKPEHAEELKILKRKLRETNDELKALTKPGH